MKYTLIILMLAGANIVSAQCFPDRHNTTWYDAWVSCETSVGPISSYGETHWIQYDLGHQYLLGEMKIWNINDPLNLDRGAQSIHVDISEDGLEWTNVGEYSLNQANGLSTYEGDEVLDFDEAQARYVLLTIESTYGANCGGISEMRIDVEGIVSDIAEFTSPNACFEVAVYPNPHMDVFNARISSTCGDQIEVELYDALGRSVQSKTSVRGIQQQVLQLGDENLPSGVYYLHVQQAGAIGRYQIVKTNN